MFYNAQNKTIKIGDTDMDYITFGTGKKNLILIPGLGDGLHTVKGKGIPCALLYHVFAKEYTAYVFSRKNKLEEGYTIRDMARDQKEVMDLLGIENADFIGVSQGGMISQYMAIDYPEKVNKLILIVTAPKANDTIREVVGSWLEMARQGRFKELNVDNAEKMYTESFLRKYRHMYPILEHINVPSDPNRFIYMAEACLTHNAEEELDRIKAPCLIIGGEKDEIVSGEASEELAGKIPGSELYMYENYGHGVFEEAEDFIPRIREFLER